MGNPKEQNKKSSPCKDINPFRTFGPVSDLERHLPSDWWKTLFNSIYLKTDGDVVENQVNTSSEVDYFIEKAGLTPDDRILDLCCGQGRHVLELARRGYTNVTGVDRSRYLIRLARKRAREENLQAQFHEGDARKFRYRHQPYTHVLLLGNSFGYFEQKSDDALLLENISRLVEPNGRLLLDIVDGEWMREHYEPRSWEWIDENQFVCRERALTRDNERIISRELVIHAEKGVITDQFYAERLYTRETIRHLLESAGFTMVAFHDGLTTHSTRCQDLGMLTNRIVLTAGAPREVIRVPAARVPVYSGITVLLGDPSLPDKVKVDGQFNEADFETITKMQEALGSLDGYTFNYHTDHHSLIGKLMTDPPEFVLNLCDEGYMNDPFKELHVPAMLDMLNIPYTGAGPACLGLCYDKNLTRAAAESLDIPVPLESYLHSEDLSATMPATFPALIKPNFGDSSMGITTRAVVRDTLELMQYITWLREEYGTISILIQEFLTGPEYSIGIVGNPGLAYKILPPLEVDYSGLTGGLPPILGYESKWLPDSPYWNQVHYRQASLDDETQRLLFDFSNKLFERLGCRDYARFDYRTDANGTVKLLEVNPNPGWCWDGKMNIMAGFEGLSYSDLLRMIIEVAQERTAAHGLQTRR